MVTKRTAKSKGNTFEYECEFNLKHKYQDIRAVEKRGFVMGYDLISDYGKVVIECKFHKSMTWNELVKIYLVLDKRKPQGYQPLVIYKTNQQPVLVFYKHEGMKYCIMQFNEMFGKEFEKRPKGYTKSLKGR